MKIKNKILTIMVTGVALSALIMPNKSNAALQSNGGTPATKGLPAWMLQIRQMQEIGGTLGRTDSVNTTNLTSGATDLDIHMEKNTEYGAMAILSASAYGNPNKINNGETTTGNSTGIVINLNGEWVSAGNLTGIEIYTNAKGRYKNLYTTSYVAKKGDAISETEGWHGSKNVNVWLSSYNGPEFANSSVGLRRGYSKSIFSYYGYAHMNRESNVYYTYASRACIVVGTGI